jgi:tRNA (guanine-N7-)-methyltransferase
MDWAPHYPEFIPSTDRKVTIADIGCGFGGLLFALSPIFPDNLLLGMEIRIQVTDYVAQKISALRTQSTEAGDTKGYQNISVVRGNAQKFLPNFFEKHQVISLTICTYESWKRCFFVSPIRILNGRNTSLGSSPPDS